MKDQIIESIFTAQEIYTDCTSVDYAELKYCLEHPEKFMDLINRHKNGTQKIHPSAVPYIELVFIKAKNFTVDKKTAWPAELDPELELLLDAVTHTLLIQMRTLFLKPLIKLFDRWVAKYNQLKFEDLAETNFMDGEQYTLGVNGEEWSCFEGIRGYVQQEIKNGTYKHLEDITNAGFVLEFPNFVENEFGIYSKVVCQYLLRAANLMIDRAIYLKSQQDLQQQKPTLKLAM